MAFEIIDQSYSGTYSEYFITHATYGMDTIRKGLVYVKGGIKKQHTIGRLDFKNPLKPRQAVPVTDNANPFEVDGRLLVPKSVDVYEEFNPRDLETNQLAEQLSETVLAREVPAGFQSQLVQLVLNRAAEQYENCIWMGSTNYQVGVPSDDPKYQLQFFDGFLKRMVSDPLINLSSVSPATITTSNIATILDDLITQATTKKKALVSDPETFNRMKFIMSPKSGSVYTQYLRTGATFKGNPFNTGYIPPWGGYAVEIVSGMADNTIIFCRATDEAQVSNLWAGMNSVEDWQLKVMRTKNADETFFIQGKWKWDVNYGWGDEIFMFTTLTAASFQV
jgi:hypothetical protein